MQTSLLRAGALSLLLAAGIAVPAADAHHSFAMFDNAKEVELEGVVREFQWTNPHSWIQLTVMEGGKAVEYSIEGSSPNGLARRGWTRNTIKSGDRIKLKMHPLKDGGKGGSFMSAVLPDGRTISSQGG